MRRFQIFLLLACCSALSVQPAWLLAQDTSDETIRINTSVVSVEVLVVDKQTGASVNGLKREDFSITDDGRPQTVAFFSQGSQGADVKLPLALVLLLDVGRRPMPEMQALRMRAAIRRAIWETLESDDQVALINLSPHYEIVKPLGHDPQAVLELMTPTAGVKRDDGGSRTRTSGVDMASALLAATRHVRERQRQFRIELVVVSEKLYASASDAGAKSAVEQLLASGAVVHAIRSAKRGAGDLLDDVCERTGGQALEIRGDDYSGALAQVVENLDKRYRLSFTPEATTFDGRTHHLGIEVRAPAADGRRRALEIRARRTYVAGLPAARGNER